MATIHESNGNRKALYWIVVTTLCPTGHAIDTEIHRGDVPRWQRETHTCVICGAPGTVRYPQGATVPAHDLRAILPQPQPAPKTARSFGRTRHAYHIASGEEGHMRYRTDGTAEFFPGGHHYSFVCVLDELCIGPALSPTGRPY